MVFQIRKCDMYKEEYSDCTNIKSRFNQYFIFGEMLDCSQWKTDLQNCRKWENERNETAYKELVNSESKRRLERLKAHYGNDVWKKRDKPPNDWNKPLPEWMQKEQENTYLNYKNNETKGGTENNMDAGISFCSIS
ncbi:UPF0545 protein C22orf39 homolog isoform X2 [Cephus cinctus]|uniref:Synaptic plasticity regulator PANTS n=1 Tax=Cephus cinctus TaxID=211228 RepID=A0AAJ7RQI1_CEPCN|nr:UPF0545 protein C22orf39 homolog isoform X2 [Cephus cinctus]